MILAELLAGPRVRLGVGGWAIQLPLLIHVGAGVAGLITGSIALAVSKGGALHKRVGIAFVYAMIVMGMTGSAIKVYEGQAVTMGGSGLMTAYFVVTALLTVRPRTATTHRIEIVAMCVGFAFALLTIWAGVSTVMAGKMVRDGVPVPMLFFLGSILLVGALSDVRVVLGDPRRGTARLARHLWRMCFALFIASGSFFIGQMQVFPKPLRIVPLLMLAGISPLLALLYWMWRVRVRQKLRGIQIIGETVPPPRAAAA